MTRRGRIAAILGAALVAVLAVAAGTVWLGFRASLPDIDGTAVLAGLGADISIDRDAAGVPTIVALNRNDLARGLGYVHAQDRFFQMDLLRRAAAGELSALLGPALLPTDRKLRVHTASAKSPGPSSPVWRRVSALCSMPMWVGSMPDWHRCAGRPFEYWLLRGRPQRWTAEDSILCVHAMYLQLQDFSRPRAAATRPCCARCCRRRRGASWRPARPSGMRQSTAATRE